MDTNTGLPYNATLRAPGEHPDSPSDHFPSSMSHDPAAAQPVVSEHQPFVRDVTGSHDGNRSVHGDHTRHSDAHFDGHSPIDSGAPAGPAQSPDGRTQSHGGRETPRSGRHSPEFAHPDAMDERASEPSPDVDLSLSTEDVTEGRHTGDGLLGGGFVNPLGVAVVAPGKLFLPGQAGKSGSVRSRGRVPDPLEVLPFDEAPQSVPAGMAPDSTRAPRRAIPHSSYYNGPPALDSAYGSDPVGVIGKHYPREILRIERDYSGGELCQFHPTFPLELEGRITPVQHQESMNSINEVLISAHKLFPSFLYNALAVVTLYVSTLFFSSHYDKEMRRLRLLIDQLNREIYNPQGLNILWPQRTAFLFLEIEYY